MKITTEILKDKKACASGISKFTEHFPSGEAEYQDVLDKLAELNDAAHANWLLQTIGKTDAVLEIDGNVERTSLFFAGSIKVTGFIKVDFCLIAGGDIKAGWGIKAGGGIEAGSDIEAGGDIKAGWGIKAGSGIEAGSDIEAGWGIEAGSDCGIFAGLSIYISKWSIAARVIAKVKPANLISGFWVEPESTEAA